MADGGGGGDRGCGIGSCVWPGLEFAIHIRRPLRHCREFVDYPSLAAGGTATQLGPLDPPKDLPTSGRPLVNLTLALNFYLGGLNTFGYHVFNLIVHGLSVLLLGLIVWRTLRLEFFGGRFTSAAGPLAFLVALLWAVHPLQTETIIYITQRTELRVGFFYLATVYCSLRYWAAVSASGQRTWLALATLACFLGVGCKEVMVTAPVAVLLFERTFVAGSFRETLRKSWRLYVGLFASWLWLLLLNADWPRSGSAGFDLGVAPHIWWITQAKVLWIYLKLVVWPWPLLIHYQLPYLVTLSAAWMWILATALLVTATVVLLWRGYSAGFVATWFFLILSPTLLVPIVTEIAAERRMYLPLATLLSLLIVGGYRLMQQALGGATDASSNSPAIRKRSLASVVGVSAILALVWCLVDVHRLAAYHDAITLWKDIAATQPDDPVAYDNWGYALQELGRHKEAVDLFLRAMKLKPDDADAHDNLGVALVNVGRFSDAIQEHQKALEINPKFPNAHNNLGVALIQTGRPQEAIAHFQEAVRLKPDYAEGYYNLARAQGSVGRFDDAIASNEQALRLNSGYLEAYNNLGVILAQTGRTSEAIKKVQQALRLKPDDPDSHNNLGNMLLQTGKPEEAIQHYQQAIHSNPDYAQAYADMAIACAQLNRSNEALAAAEKAITLARAQGEVSMAQQIESWLNAYRSKLTAPSGS
jgi:protein O-mannosyl-transferase